MLLSAIFFSSLALSIILPIISIFCLSFFYLALKSSHNIERVTYHFVRTIFCGLLSASLTAFLCWLFLETKASTINIFTWHFSENFHINFRLFYDTYGLIFLNLTSIIANVIVFFSHRYLHRDPSYVRFFLVISAFVLGLNLLALAGTMDIIFAGWEIMGLASFLLIAYFWHRPKATAAANQAYFIYRFCDMGMLISIILTHFFWHDVSIFGDFLQLESQSVLLHVPDSFKWLLSSAILLAAMGKAAQFPFCFWLPKAMEGPTQSSAIFYGSLSIHAGVFLLIRTASIWQHTPHFNFLLLIVGILSAVVGTSCALVQSNIKGQIAYASIAQVGLMLVELSLGFKNLAFYHLVGNAFLRCFQLLVSPSILATHLHWQGTPTYLKNFSTFSILKFFPHKLRPTIYCLALNEWYLESILKNTVKPVFNTSVLINKILKKPIKYFNFAKKIFLNKTEKHILQVSYYPLVLILALILLAPIIITLSSYKNYIFVTLALVLSLASLGEQNKAIFSIFFAGASSAIVYLSLAPEKIGLVFLGGLALSFLFASYAIYSISRSFNINNLKHNYGLQAYFPNLSIIFLLAILGLISFPISSTFIGEDYLMTKALEAGPFFLISLHLCFVITGISLIKLYSSLMLGKRNNINIYQPADISKTALLINSLILLGGNTLLFSLAG